MQVPLIHVQVQCILKEHAHEFVPHLFFNTLCFNVYVWHVRIVVRKSWYFLSYVINSEHRVVFFI